jgi:hypothetical protein
VRWVLAEKTFIILRFRQGAVDKADCKRSCRCYKTGAATRKVILNQIGLLLHSTISQTYCRQAGSYPRIRGAAKNPFATLEGTLKGTPVSSEAESAPKHAFPNFLWECSEQRIFESN